MIPGGTSTGSKRQNALFGKEGGPRRMVRSRGCRVWDEAGVEYVDTIMALGAVALGYADPGVTAEVCRAAEAGVVGPLPPVAEEEIAERLSAIVPGAEAVRFLKTGAEAVAAAVRVARVITGRDGVVTCGYHGWLDWCQTERGVPDGVRALRREIPFNAVAALTALAGTRPAAIVVEPVVDAAPTAEWVRAVRAAATRAGALLVLDEIKTGVRFGPGGAAARYGFEPDLVVLGKALGNGYPIAAVAGRRDVMDGFERTWVSSTLATEFVALAAARAVLDAVDQGAHGTIASGGARFLAGLERLAREHAPVTTGVRGIAEFCYLTFRDDETSARVAAYAAAHGLLFKRNAYNFPSAAHDDEAIDTVLDRLARALAEVAAQC